VRLLGGGELQLYGSELAEKSGKAAEQQGRALAGKHHGLLACLHP